MHGQGKISANGLVGCYAYEADPRADAVYTFPEGQGFVIACSALRVQKFFVGGLGRAGPVQDDRRSNWGPAIRPGLYHAIVLTGVAVPCIEVPPLGTGQRADVLGAEEYDDSIRAF